MRICLISVEIFAWGKYGGFGRATRMLGRELVKRGYQVAALIPCRAGQQAVEILDGITVYGYSPKHPLEMLRVFRNCQADIYHSQEPSFATWLAEMLHPEKKHIVTFRDTRMISDWWIELTHYSASIFQVLSNVLYEDNFLVHIAVRKANALFAASQFVAEKAKRKYHLKNLPAFLPTLVEIPSQVEKDANPTVCYVSRWDRRKRPEILVKLAKAYPGVRFIAAGGSRDPRYDQKIRQQLEMLPNVELYGMINQFESGELSNIYSQSWILLNSSYREGFPISFIEACGARCALLSSVNPDDFSSRFGYFASDIDFVSGLDFLLSGDRWKSLGETGHQFVQDIFNFQKAIALHEEVYKNFV
jgi:glycosyltransferase involved in cell wall biosynthesis